MPIYEYQCTECGHKMDKFQKMDSPPITTCPQCNNESMKKMVTAAAFQLKGGGWYETDFKDKKPKSKPEDTASADSSKKTEKKPDTTNK